MTARINMNGSMNFASKTRRRVQGANYELSNVKDFRFQFWFLVGHLIGYLIGVKVRLYRWLRRFRV
jgi:hypothetical protein